MRNNSLIEAEKFCEILLKQHSTDAKIMAWYGRVLLYNNKNVLGKKMLTQSLQFDPENKDAARAIRALKIGIEKKEKASEAFSQQNYDVAISLFDECLAIDELNVSFNATILLNKAITMSKLNLNDGALVCLN